MEDQPIEPEVVFLELYINNTWPCLGTRTHVRLNELFPEPENKGLKHIWKYGHADVVVERNSKVVAVLEPGGNHHLQDEKQRRNDRRKYKLCDINGVRCLHYMNNIRDGLSNRKWRSMIGGAIFGYRE